MNTVITVRKSLHHPCIYKAESNQRTSIPHFAWFHPGTYAAATTSTGFNVFQGTQTNPEGITAIPITPMVPVNEAANNLNPESEPAKPTKKPKMSKNSSDDSTSKEAKSKQSKKRSSNPKKTKGSGSSSAKPERNDLSFASYESNADASGIPAPVCTCTGVARQCYRGGAGAWQPLCCTTHISEYPLPLSTTRPGSRVAGRKMSHGVYDKLLQRLAAEGYDLSHPIDLKDHWAKHGTNKFVTIK
ncbi:hypothetical protein Cgig2_029424 [Carnegiea gigantea]|uniref:GAGA-binding transcriptional activator n=1 Tax=Carnegiea gigantea TaxID=171969 RepID=A0A9Q1JNS6_9CARY|nr:hypothetical protein Cgig2_029424 [Carnegiea gigantea]